MDVRRLVRMTTGGLACLVIGAVSQLAIVTLFMDMGEGTTRLAPWLGVLILGVLTLEAFVVTVAGLILVIWALVAAIAGPPVAPMDAAATEVQQRTPRPKAVRAAGSISEPVTPTAMRDPDGGSSHLDDGVAYLDPEKRRPAQF